MNSMDPSSEPVRLVVIDDEPSIRNILRVNLESNGYRVKEASTGQRGLDLVKEFHPHLVLLDLELPDMNGKQILSELRQWSQVPVIVLTVEDQENIKVDLLDRGADDYLTKPFGLKELMARVRVVLRNRGLIEATPIFKSGSLEINLATKEIRKEGVLVKLTQTEFTVLAILIRSQGRVVPQKQILRDVWGVFPEDQTPYLRIYINQLRKKLEVNPSNPIHIITDPGVGYRIV